jgi:hypothetical protein
MVLIAYATVLPNSNADEVWPVLLPEYAEIRMLWLSLAPAPIPSMRPSDTMKRRNERPLAT